MEIESLNKVKPGFVAHCWEMIRDKVVELVMSVRKLGEDDPRRIVHSLKVGFALAVVSLIYYVRPLYDGFGVAGIWAVITVVVIFEFSVGATLSKGLNRAFATLLAGGLGLGAQHLAHLSGEKGEPILLGLFVFFIAGGATFSRFFPKIKARYDYGVVIFILTFSLITVSGYRVDEIVEMSHQRLSTIMIGGATCIFISICICPVWAGQDLHKSVYLNIENLGNYLEGFGGECFRFCDQDGTEKNGKVDKSYLQAYKIVLNSKAAEENLVNFARWETAHGKFMFRHPWTQYLKIGALTRQCAYQIEALNAYMSSGVQGPTELLTKIQESCAKMSSESGKAMIELSASIKTMTIPSSVNLHLENSKHAVKNLQIALTYATLEETDLLAIIPTATIASILIETVKSVETLVESVQELSRLANFKKADDQSCVSLDKPRSILRRGSVKPVTDGDHISIIVDDVKQNIENVREAGTYPKARQMLFFRGSILKDGTTLDENKVTSKATFVLMLGKHKNLPGEGSSTAAAITTKDSQTQGNFQHLLSQSNTHMSYRQMVPHQPYQFHQPIFPRIQPTFELGAAYIPTPQVENANVNFETNARNKDNGNNYE